MRLVTLNTWGGRVNSPLIEFISSHIDKIDIFCFQEVFSVTSTGRVHEKVVHDFGLNPDVRLFETLRTLLPDHASEFCQVFRGTYGLATFFRSSRINIIDHGETFIARGDWEVNEDIDTKDHHRKLQWLELKIDGKTFLIANVHCTHRPEGKKDSEKRLMQSRIIIDFLKMFDCPKILVGDFNLLPDTESIRMIEDSGMENLVRKYNIPTTRTKLYRRWENGPKYADYIFVSPDVKVNEFKVLSDEISDHAPLFLDFEVM